MNLMKHILLVICLLLSRYGYTQVQAQNIDTIFDARSYSFLEVMPKPGYSLGGYLSENLHYPESARLNNVEGRVVIMFVVDKDGRISEAKIVKGIDDSCDAEALRVVKNMPPWRPGRQNGKAVKVYYNLPVMFKLDDPEPPSDEKK